MAEGMRAGVPTIIVEHCFLSSTTDVLFVSDENGMVDYEKTAAIGKSDAEAVATYFNLERRVLQAGQTGELELEKGYSARLETSGDAVWTSNNESCVTVDEYGNIKAVGSGSAVLSYTASDGTAGVVNVKVDIPEQIAITGFIDPTFYKTKEKFSEIDLSTVKAVIAYSDGSVIQVIPEKVGEVDYNKPGIQDIPISYGALKGFVRVVNQTEDYIPEVTSKEPETETQTAEPETTTQISSEEPSQIESTEQPEVNDGSFDIVMIIKMAAGIVIVIALATVIFFLENRVSGKRRGRRNRRRRRY